MHRRQAAFVHHALFLMALASVVVVGNARPVISDATGATRDARVAASSSGTAVGRAADPDGFRSVLRLASGDEGSRPDDADRIDGAFVPAIYAWDPDVRFVYFRQVSKWM